MASLVSWLAYDGATNSAGSPLAGGEAYFYVPGSTSTQVATYSDEDGLVPLAQPVTLDAAGKAVVYTLAPCRVEVYDYNGNLIESEERVNTVTASQVEVQNSGFTGTNLQTLATGQAGGRTDLDSVLTSAYASFGDQDWTIGGQYVKDVVGTFSYYFDVKASSYGAMGDDSTDDTAAIQAAVTACNASTTGGIVFFPAGTYRISSAISIPSSKIKLMGVNQGASVIKQTTAAAQSFSITAAGTHCVVEDLGFTPSATTHTGTIINSAAVDTTVRNCAFNGHAGTAINASTSRCKVIGCEFTISNVAGRCATIGSTIDGIVTGCSISYSVSPTNPLFNAAVVTGCTFVATAATLNMTIATGSAGQVCTNNTVSSSGGTTSIFPNTATTCVESGNVKYVSTDTLQLTSAAITTTASIDCPTIERQVQRSSINANNFTIDPRLGCRITVINALASTVAVTVNATTSYWDGAMLYLWYGNSSAANNHTLTFATGAAGTFDYNGAIVVTAGSGYCQSFRYDGTFQRWIEQDLAIAGYASDQV